MSPVRSRIGHELVNRQPPQSTRPSAKMMPEITLPSLVFTMFFVLGGKDQNAREIMQPTSDDGPPQYIRQCLVSTHAPHELDGWPNGTTDVWTAVRITEIEARDDLFFPCLPRLTLVR